MSKTKTKMIQGHKESKLLALAVKEVKAKSGAASIFDEDAERRIPKFSMSELSLGRVLGSGGFCEVFEINKIALNRKVENATASSNKASAPAGDEYDEHQIHNIVQDRRFMERHCVRGTKKDARYAIKILHEQTRTEDASHYVNGVVDLAMEARFLSIIRHPNIIKMRAMQCTDLFNQQQCNHLSYCTGDFFLVLDRLYDTLTVRLKTWRKWEYNKHSCVMKLLCDPSGKKSRRNWVERCNVAYELATAIKYLHDLHIMYRDLKPDNIGFDVRGDVKIFDFGLAKEFHPEQADGNGTYNFTGDTGSPRYMSPECHLHKPYNELTDVYGFCILTWEILELETPFVNYTSMKTFQTKVIKGGSRPRFGHPNWFHLSPRLMDTIQKGWGNVRTRPDMERVCEELRDNINSLSDEDVNMNFDVSHKSDLSAKNLRGESTRGGSNTEYVHKNSFHV